MQEEQSQTLVAKGPHAVAAPQENTRYIVRRLTPLECCRLQGFPDYWTRGLETSEPTEQEIDWWLGIFETHRLSVNPQKKPKTRNQVRKWLTKPNSNSAEYKMWGNSLAIPCAYTVLSGVAEELRRQEAMTDKENKAIMRIRNAYEIAQNMGRKLIVAYSGGKDSDVLLALAIKSGVPFEAQHNHTTVDAPQTVYHIREVFQCLTEQGIPNKINYPPEITTADGKTIRASMWNLIPIKRMPPTRIARYCCEYFKERRFEGQHIMTGVRWGESRARKQRGVHEALNKNKEKRVVYFDEDDDRHKMTDICQLRNRVATNPIIDWTDKEVWEYIRINDIKTNPLYFTHGMKRVGCVGCPLAGYAGHRRELEMFPKYKQAYLRTFEKLLEVRRERNMETGKWKNADDVYNWWTDPKFNPDQISLFDEMDGSDEI